MNKTLSFCFYLCFSATLFAQPIGKSYLSDFWNLTRKSNLVVIGVVEKSDLLVSLSVIKYLKGRPSSAGRSLVFPCPPVSKNQKREGFLEPPPHLLEFRKGERWLVFLNETPNSGLTLVDAATNIADGEKAVRNVLAFDSIKREDMRCRMLVRFVCTSNDISALRELSLYNKPQYLKILTPIGNTDKLLPYYTGLLRDNSNVDATSILITLLNTKKGKYLVDVISALSWKDHANDSISERILSFIEHPRVDVRMMVIASLNRRDYRKAFPQIANCLNDVDQFVRYHALCWPWYAYDFTANPATLKKIRILVDDQDSFIRKEACWVLNEARQTRYFYLLWEKSLFDESELVRYRIDLGILFEQNPSLILFFVFWPTLVLFAILFIVLKRRSSTRVLKVFALIIPLGYLCGALGGWLIGEFHSSHRFFNAIILGPGIVLPIFLIACLYWTIKKVPKPTGDRLIHKTSGLDS
jgi:HEAT repeat protein